MPESSRAPIACTIVARNYLPAAQVLAESYLRHHSDHRFVIAVIDAGVIEGETDGTLFGEHADAGYTVVGPEAFGIENENYLRMATAYSVTELATSVKPYLLRSLRRQADVVCYFDPDIQVFAPMPELVDLAMAHQIVLTPHVLEPIPRDDKEPEEVVVAAAGVFNLGFIGTGPGSERFLDFWAERLRQDAIISREQQLFTDQRWVDLVPAMFEHHVLRDPGFNVAYWNLHERTLSRDVGGNLHVNGSPLRFFHYSGYRPEKPWLLSMYCRYRPRILLSEHSVVRQLCAEYSSALKAAGYAETLEAVPYAFDSVGGRPVGGAITHDMRRLFREAWVEAERSDSRTPGRPVPPHAFGSDRGKAFRDWITTPETSAQRLAGLNRLTFRVWENRLDVRVAFADPLGVDAADFRQWCRASGLREGHLASWALPVEPGPIPAPANSFGVNVLGYLTAELGVGEMGRIVLRAIEGAGVPVASVVEDELVLTRTALDTPDSHGDPRFGVSLLAVNADQTGHVLKRHPEMARDRYRIGLWAWELEEFPEQFDFAFGLVDEVWTISEFCAKAIGKRSPVPVRVIPVPVEDRGEPLPTPEDMPLQFLFMFDFNSTIERKNPYAVIEAFQRAFGDRDDVRLVIKAINGENHLRDVEPLRMQVAGDPRIELMERFLSVSELDRLYRESVCYVSLHRSEGFGLTVAEAMIRGLPVISTDYSGTAEFLDAETGWPIRYTMTTVPAGCEQYPEGAIWAEPDIDAAAAAMCEIAANPAEAARRGRAARAHLLNTRSLGRAMRWMRERLSEAHRTWLADRSSAPPGVSVSSPDPVAAVRIAREALRWRADPGMSSRHAIAPALRRLVLRALDHYDVHQRKVMGALMDGVEQGMQQLAERMRVMETQLANQGHALRGQSEELRVRLSELRQDAEARAGETVSVAGRLTELRSSTASELGQLRDEMQDIVRKHHEMFAYRDRRADSSERELRELFRREASLHETARMLHAPVPPGTDVALCDAGALLMPEDAVVLPGIREQRSWEREEARLMVRIAGAGTFLDIGAHAGYHTLRMLRDSPQIGKVIAVEANPRTAELLRRNVTVNLNPELAERVTVLPVAAWDSAGEVTFAQVEADNSGDFRVRPGEGRALASTMMSVPAVRLDTVPEIIGDPVGLVKVDLQGRDHRALAGLADVLKRDRPQVLCEFTPAAIVELGDDPAQVLATYRGYGYRLIPLAEDGPQDGEHDDPALIRLAESAPGGYITLWLRPL